VLPISDRLNDYARSVKERLRRAGIRVELDERGESVGRKIREAELRKIPHMLILGDREATEGTVSLREHRSGDAGSVSLEEVLQLYSATLPTRTNPPHAQLSLDA